MSWDIDVLGYMSSWVIFIFRIYVVLGLYVVLGYMAIVT